ncbi:MAG TPA: epimerase, partial [Phycisphaerales bacterium]|nr:epimerase [Phycisphaerales bacterium]
MADANRLDESELEDLLSEPTDISRGGLQCVKGDVVVLGAGGKMGPTLAMMLKKADPGRNVYAVSRFSEEAVRRRIEDTGINTVALDLLDDSAYGRLP